MRNVYRFGRNDAKTRSVIMAFPRTNEDELPALGRVLCYLVLATIFTAGPILLIDAANAALAAMDAVRPIRVWE
jgi:hypothetical protein